MRRKFLLGILGALGLAKAQVRISSPLRETRADGFAEWRNSKAKNNQCPVCGTMADPFKPTVEEWTEKYGHCAPTGGLAVCRGWEKSDLPKSREVRCSRCNGAFWQDAE